MKHLGTLITQPPEAALDVEHAAKIAKHNRLGLSGLDVMDLLIDDSRRDISVFHGEGASKSAAGTRVFHLFDLQSRDLCK